jgi:hypothetical protein
VAINVLGAGAFLAIPFAWLRARQRRPIEAGIYLGTASLLAVGALVWGARLGDFNMFHAFFGAIAVFATPVAAVAVWSIWLRLRAAGRASLAVVVLLLAVTQIEFGLAFSVLRLAYFGPGNYPPVPVALLATIRGLPPDAKLAYACQPSEELSFWDARLIGLDAHAGRRIVPMCFQAETLGAFTGTPMSADVASPLFAGAPQAALYPDSGVQPSSASVVSFLRANGIDYIYADAGHPNTLVPDATPVASIGGAQILEIP